RGLAPSACRFQCPAVADPGTSKTARTGRVFGKAGFIAIGRLAGNTNFGPLLWGRFAARFCGRGVETPRSQKLTAKRHTLSLASAGQHPTASRPLTASRNLPL